jgi:single-strand DNA-binding protein
MLNVNQVTLAGNVVRDPEIHHTRGGSTVARLSLANNRTYTYYGETRRETTYVNLVAWGTLAQRIQEHVRRGTGLYVTGRLHSRTFDGQDGVRRAITEVVIERFQLTDRKATPPSRAAEAPASPIAPGDDQVVIS